MRILHIISGDLWAGAEVMVYTLLKGLTKHPDLELHAIVLNNGVLAQHLENCEVRSQVVDEARFSFLELSARISKIIKFLKPDVIHSHRYKENILAYLAVLWYSSKPVLIATQHGMPELLDTAGGSTLPAILRLNRWLLSKKFRMTIAVSEDIRGFLMTDEGFPCLRLSVIPNGIEIPETIRSVHHRENLWIGSAGRFFPVKDYPFLVEVAKEVSNSNDDIFFRIVGDGPQFAAVKSKVRQYGITQRVKLPGFVEDMPSFYRDIDAYISTSLHEGLPMSVLEAMAHGLPIIAPRVGGLGEIIRDGEEGFLIDNRTPERFAEKCILLAKNPILRKKMSQAARRRVVDRFSAEKMAKQYHDLYRREAHI